MSDAPSGHDRQASGGQSTAPLVMVVDDEPVVLSTLERLVSAWGFRTIALGSFEEARQALTYDPPDALVTDVRLGDYNGLQLVHLVKQRNPATIVVAVSGIDDPVLRVEAANAGAAYLLKPSELPRLRQYLSGKTPDPRTHS